MRDLGEGKIPTTLTTPCHTSNGQAGTQVLNLNGSQILRLLVASLMLRGLFRFPNSPSYSTMQKEDFLSHQNVGTCMEY
jgi:hypothetical protein